MQERLFHFVAEFQGLQFEAISRKTTFEDLDLDSLELVSMLSAIEEAFTIPSIPDRIAASFETVGDILDHLELVGA